jgi:hypothetical protein
MTDGGSWFSPKVRRRLLITLYVVTVLVAVLLTVVLVAAITSRTKFSLSDRLAAINNVIAGAGLILALSGGLITLRSLAAKGSPEIQVQVWFGGDRKNGAVVVASPSEDGMLRSVDVAGQACLNVRLKNVSRFDASDLVVSVHLEGMFFDRDFDTTANGWRIIDAVEGRGAIAAEWIGYSLLHGQSTRRLPELDMRSIVSRPDAAHCALHIHVASVGHTRKIDVPVQFLQARPTGGVEPVEGVSPPDWL